VVDRETQTTSRLPFFWWLRKPSNWQLARYVVPSRKMISSGTQKQNKNPLPLNQRRRPRPSRVKSLAPYPTTPSERLCIALELSDFCLALREAAQRKS